MLAISFYISYKAVWQIHKLIVIAEKKCLLLEINTITKFLLFRMKYIIDRDVYLIIGSYNYFMGNSHIESSHSLRQYDAKLQTHPPSTLNVKMPNLPKIDVYNFKLKLV